MKPNRLLGAAFTVFALSTGATLAQPVSGPAERPPQSYTQAQYIDSRGCVFSRAAIDGSVTWVARVTPDRLQVCGRTPSLEQPRAQMVVRPPAPRPIPAQVLATPSAVTPVVKTQQSLTTPGLLKPATRIVPRHVYDKRQNTRTAHVPRGYRSVWTDDRLNPRRAEMTLAPSQTQAQGNPPRGFRAAWDDGRLNTNRGQHSAYGDDQTNSIWTQTVPRTLVQVPTQVPVVVIERPKQPGNTPFWQPNLPDQTLVGAGTVMRLSTRSDPHRFRPRADR